MKMLRDTLNWKCVLLIGAVILWWGASSLCAVASWKFFSSCLSTIECAAFLTAGQLLFCALPGVLYSFTDQQFRTELRLLLCSQLLQGISFLHLLVCFSSNVAISKVGISQTYIVKALEPVMCTVAWQLWTKTSEPVALKFYFALFAFLSGFLGCIVGYGQLWKTVSGGTFVAFSSATLFSVRSVASKLYLDNEGTVVIFTQMSLVSFMLSLVLLFPMCSGSLRQIIITSTITDQLLSACTFVVYNFVSLFVLSCTNPSWHSVLKSGKHMAIILLGSVRDSLSTVQYFSVGLISVGTLSLAAEFKASKKLVIAFWWLVMASMVALYFTIQPQIWGTEALMLATVSPKVSRAPKRWVVLLGPHDRHNFGDLLFTKVVSRLLTTRGENPYLESELLPAGITKVDMSEFGGAKITSLKQVVHMSVSGRNGPFDLVNLGGEATGCDHACGVSMLPTLEQQALAKLEKVSDCAYILPKSLLLPSSWNSTEFPRPVAILNSLGGHTVHESCKEAVETADVKGFRNPSSFGPLTPDSAVMVDMLFRDVITFHASNGEVYHVKQNTSEYVAVQLSSAFTEKYTPETIAVQLDKVHDLTNMTAVFFRAGAAPFHDTLESYHGVIKHMKSPALIFHSLHVFRIVALISRASLVLSTSLHVRIMAFIHRRPRMTVCTGSKQKDFVASWDASDSSPCHLDMQNWTHYSQLALAASENFTESAVNRAVREYLNFFDGWVQLLDN